MSKKYSSLIEIVEVVKRKMADNAMTMEEISENTEISEDLLAIYLSDTESVVTDLSKLLAYMNMRMRVSSFRFNPYRIYDDGVQIKVFRANIPKCSAIYDRRTQKFYQFEFVKAYKETETINKNTILTEMNDFIGKHLERRAKFMKNR